MTNKLFSNNSDDAEARRILLFMGLRGQAVGPGFSARMLWDTAHRGCNSLQSGGVSFAETLSRFFIIILSV